MRGSLDYGQRRVASACVIGLVLVAVFVSAATAGAAERPPQPETDNTVTRIHVYQNGSARWTIQIRTRLDTDDRADEYEAFQTRFRENTSRYLDPFRDRMTGVVANAANATGREMRAVSFSASTSTQEVPRRWGIVTYQFTWTGFAVRQNGTLAVGDVFRGGFFLAANDTLEIEAPTDYEITRVEPTPDSRDDGVVTWVGREDFADRRPHVVFTPATEGGATSGAAQPGSQSRTTDGWRSPVSGFPGAAVALGGMLLLGVAGIGAYAAWRRHDGLGGTDRAARASTETDSTTTTQTPADQEEPSAETGTGAEVMTDAERVRELLEVNDGRMRQTDIADELDWSASKTSRVVGKMTDEGTVEKLQLGRENLIEMAEHDT